MNMSYCQFENTLTDLKQCLDTLENREISSQSEKRKARRMLEEFLNFCVGENIIESYSTIKIMEIINECK